MSMKLFVLMMAMSLGVYAEIKTPDAHQMPPKMDTKYSYPLPKGEPIPATMPTKSGANTSQ
jgi:hypothetical protein